MKTPLTVSTFPNAKALPLWVASETGVFDRFGLSVSIDETESSKAQRGRLLSGEVQIAQAAVDNDLALIKAGHDAVIVMGGESGMNDFIVQNDIADFTGMRGRTLVVDSPDTAYALQARKLLARAGLVAGTDYTIQPVGNASLRLKAMLGDRKFGGAVMNPPFSSEAKLSGMQSLGRMIDLLGPYQAGGAFVLREWASLHQEVLENYIRAYVTALRWLSEPANKMHAVTILRAHLKLTPEVADVAFAQLTDPAFGFTPDARIDMQGIHNMLAIRAETDGSGGVTLDPAQFLDLTYYNRAMAALGTV
jgi:ABC-type nitrate/sulfonate/bicarbonate transport system substrate-binding protein